jgi:hypothetical protein
MNITFKPLFGKLWLRGELRNKTLSNPYLIYKLYNRIKCSYWIPFKNIYCYTDMLNHSSRITN